MPRKVFYSFHFDNDCWRTNQVRHIGVIDGNKAVHGNEWEEVKRKGDWAIENWINSQLDGRTCTIVLVGSQTANRPWVKYEICRSWERGMGLVGIRIHKLLTQSRIPTIAGPNPFAQFKVHEINMSQIVHLYDPPQYESKAVFDEIAKNISGWVETAISIRSKYP
jgi:hypothetical protein